MFSAALTSMLTGITEPLEFTFLFVAPLLYGIHCVFAGLAYMLMHVFNVGVGMTFSGGLIDMFLFGILQGNGKTNWIWIVIVGIGYFVVYYFLFSLLIKKMNLKTPGRDDSEEVKLYRRSDVEAKKNAGKDGKTGAGDEDEMSIAITAGLGGKKNISDVDCCATRLRCTVFDAAKVQEGILKSTGASGIIKKGNGVQVIYGPRVAVIKSKLQEYLEHAPEDEDYSFEAAEQEEKAVKKQSENKKAAKSVIIYSPMTGIAGGIETAPDEGFAQKMMGDGAVVEPKTSEVTAPANGEIAFVFPSKHAIGFVTEDGISMLLHVGIDTVNLEGEGFEVLVNEGDKVKAGTVLMKLDLELLRKKAPSLVSPIICTELEDNQVVRVLKTGEIKAGDELYAIDFLE